MAVISTHFSVVTKSFVFKYLKLFISDIWWSLSPSLTKRWMTSFLSNFLSRSRLTLSAESEVVLLLCLRRLWYKHNSACELGAVYYCPVSDWQVAAEADLHVRKQVLDDVIRNYRRQIFSPSHSSVSADESSTGGRTPGRTQETFAWLESNTDVWLPDVFCRSSLGVWSLKEQIMSRSTDRYILQTQSWAVSWKNWSQQEADGQNINNSCLMGKYVFVCFIMCLILWSHMTFNTSASMSWTAAELTCKIERV